MVHAAGKQRFDETPQTLERCLAHEWKAEGPLMVDSCQLHPHSGSGCPVEWEAAGGRDSRREGEERRSHVSGKISR